MGSTTNGNLISRRTLLAAAGGVSLTALLAACAGGSGGNTVNIYSWADYFSPENLKAFAKSTGVKTNVSAFDSNDVLFSKLNSAARTNYDIVIPASGWIEQYAKRNLLAKLDHSRLALDTLDPQLLNRDYDPGNQFSIPKSWGIYGVIYDPEITGEINTWEDFFAAGLKQAVRGKIRLATAGYETVGMQFWMDGTDWNTATKQQISAAGSKLATWVKQAKPVFTEFDPDALVRGDIVLAVNAQGGARTVLKQNPKLRWVVPTPTSELWVDSYAIPRGAQNEDAAYKFLKYQLTEAAQVRDTEYIGYPAALKDLESKLPADTQLRDLIFGGPKVDLKKLTTFIVRPETLASYQNVQTHLQSLT